MRFAALLSVSMAKKLHAAEANWGWLDLVVHENEELVGVCGYSMEERLPRHFRPRDEFPNHKVIQGRCVQSSAVWYRGGADVPVSAWRDDAWRRGIPISVTAFKDLLRGGWRVPPRDRAFLALVEDRSKPDPEWTGWRIEQDLAAPAELIVFDPALDPFSCLVDLWPVGIASDAHAVIIGVGSIGSAAAVALAEYGIGTISLVDHDRLKPRNLVRHQCGPGDIGRYKVAAVAELLREKPGVDTIVPYRLNVIRDANLIRGILKTSDIAIVCTDGVASRQACNHLIRWAGIDSVFACVLEDGAFGEIHRLLFRHGVGCLWCHRRALRDAHQLDPEPGLDLGYGTGTAHRPMTAVGGDLHLMGALAAKCSVATLLERRGFREHRLVGDHLVIGLQPQNPYAVPFDIGSVMKMLSRALPPPNPECPACAVSPLHAPS